MRAMDTTMPLWRLASIHEGTEVSAIMSGKVLIASNGNTGYGNYIVINHGSGFVSLYAHLSKIMIAEGSNVSKGDVIGKSGNTGNSTGPHLHLEIRNDEKKPINPSTILDL